MNVKPEPLCALVVDDEKPARERLVERLKKDRDIGRILEAEDGIAAVQLIQQTKPDIAFLDVQMPGIDGFGVIDAIGVEHMPLTVFVTAYDHFAVKAFEADAIDYLLKPFGGKRYDATMDRVKRHLHDRSSRQHNSQLLGPEVAKLIATRNKPGELWDWIVVRSRDDIRLILAEDIDWIRAAGIYVTVHTAGENFLYRASLATVAKRLDPFRFIRIHRSSLVNLRSIALLERRSHGEFEVVLTDGTRLNLSRTYRADLEARLGQIL
jgi:two-component system LytT family response regulator